MPSRRIQKVLIANRGEIAVRIARACRDLGVRSVAVYSQADVRSPHVRLADEAHLLGPAPASESYLSVERLLDVARRSGADAVHPGYGFLSERPDFARACREAGLTFIGPSPEAMALLGNKTEARQLADRAGVPIAAGTLSPLHDVDQARRVAADLGYPVMLKAAAGGGGKGMRVVSEPDELQASFRMAVNEASAAFGDGSVYLERYIARPRHIEVQILADEHGRVVALGERECSIQRRHQKVVEEAPSPAVDASLRERLYEAALRVAKAAGYTNAGTVEFLVDAEGRFYFLEVNARIQVEHPVTEMVTGLDLLAEQIRLAAGERLGYAQADVRLAGHALECRVYAEDPRNAFYPSVGRLDAVTLPDGPGLRVDGAVEQGLDVPVYYDPLLFKLISWGRDRPQACARMRRALEETLVLGVHTTLGFHRWLLEQPEFQRGEMDTGFVERAWGPGPALGSDTLLQAAVVAALVADAARPTSVDRVERDDGSAWRAMSRQMAVRQA